MNRFKEDFQDLLVNHDLNALEHHHDAVYGVWSDLRLAYFNAGWFQFAERNGGQPSISANWVLGASILDAMSDLVRPYYAIKYKHCLQTGEVSDHDYECSSESLYRRFHQIIYPLGKGEGLLIVNSIALEKPHDSLHGSSYAPDKKVYADSHGFVHQCAHCRRVQNLQVDQRWDWVPQWVSNIPTNTSHTFCPICLAHYYPIQEDKPPSTHTVIPF